MSAAGEGGTTLALSHHDKKADLGLNVSAAGSATPQPTVVVRADNHEDGQDPFPLRLSPPPRPLQPHIRPLRPLGHSSATQSCSTEVTGAGKNDWCFLCSMVSYNDHFEICARVHCHIYMSSFGHFKNKVYSVRFKLNIFSIELKSPLSQDNLCVAPKSLWNRLQCSQKNHQETRRNPDQNQKARCDSDQNQETHRNPDQNKEGRHNPDQKQQSRGAARGQIRSSTNLRRSFFPSFSEMVFQMQQTLGKEKPKDFEPGKKMSGKSLEGAIVRLKATEERGTSRVGEGKGGGEVGEARAGAGGDGGGRGGRIRTGQVEKDFLWRGHQCYYNPASCY